MQTTTRRAVGMRLRRKEDPRFLTGRGRYVDDLRIPGLLHLAFVRSVFGHALIRSIDVEEALKVPGVVGVFTHRDIQDVVKSIRAICINPGYKMCDTPILADGKVRMVGEAVVAVVAESRYQAEDGADAVMVEYDPLPVVTTIEHALGERAPAVHDDIPDNVYNEFQTVTGDIEGAFGAAALVVEMEYRSQRCAPVPLEGRAVIADFDSSVDQLTLWCTHQAPHLLRTGLSRVLGLPENRIRIISPDVGGAFGSKLILYQEDAAVAAISRKLGRPVKWTSDRREDLQTTMQGREQVHRMRAAVSSEGKVLGVQVEIDANNGAYAVWPMTAGLDSGQASENITGPYDIPNYERKVRALVSNKAPMGPYRGVGRPMACFTMERTLDEIARRVGIDPFEIRLRNVVQSFPYDTPVELRLESGNYVESIRLLRSALDYDRVKQEIEELRKEGRYRGVGVALIVEHTALGCQEVSRKGIDIGLGYDSATVRVEPDGKVTVAVGLHSHGQGQETTMSQIAADELGIPVEDISIIFGDTAVVPYGLGTWASRSTVFCGGATILAARDVRDKMRRIGASMLEASPDDIEVADGAFAVRGAPSRSVTFADVARRANHEPQFLPEDVEPGLESTRRYMAPDPGSFSSAAHGAVVEVDVDTGQIDIQRYVVVEDCGTMVNPLIIEGQLHGGVAQGIGHALLEDMVYDDDGQVLSSTFMDYLIPGFREVPDMEVVHLETPSPLTLGGFKGMGESGAINPPAALANAVTNALAPFGITVNHTPITPEWIVRAVRAMRGEPHGGGEANRAHADHVSGVLPRALDH